MIDSLRSTPRRMARAASGEETSFTGQLRQELVLIDGRADGVLVDGRVHKAGTNYADAHAVSFRLGAQRR